MASTVASPKQEFSEKVEKDVHRFFYALASSHACHIHVFYGCYRLAGESIEGWRIQPQQGSALPDEIYGLTVLTLKNQELFGGYDLRIVRDILKLARTNETGDLTPQLDDTGLAKKLATFTNTPVTLTSGRSCGQIFGNPTSAPTKEKKNWTRFLSKHRKADL